ncbi:choline transporter-like protein 4 isoform X3 [Haliotis rufescens]|uniref:choline transporter-like protein 4 isoform X3 n=1 Tax=Haliotis rufescens TaxID=6454 RepID=UPI00201E9BB6|nr:choline transporter-like protein 4 isoform X3 [Haliotis rufescens]
MSKVAPEDKPSPGGKPLVYDPSFKGPIKKRSCTDIICCILFLAFVAGQVVVGFYAYAYGDPTLLLYPQDSEGNLCGIGSMRGKTDLFFFDLTECGRMGPGVFINGCPTPQVCVSSCPTSNYVAFPDFLKTGNAASDLICVDGADKTKQVSELVTSKACAPFYLKSTSVVNRCLPDISQFVSLGNSAAEVATSAGSNIPITDGSNNTVTGEALKVAEEVFQAFLKAKEYGEKIISDIVETWYLILVCLVLTMIVSLVYIVIMRWIAGFMVFFSLVAFVGIFGAGSGYCFYQWYYSRGSQESYTIYMGGLTFTFQKEKLFLGCGITAGAVFLIVMLILLFLISRIRIAIALIKEGSRAVGNMMFTLVWPIFPFILQLAVVGVQLAIAVYLASIGRNQQLGQNNITFANGTVNEDLVKQTTKNLFQQIPCDTDANDTTLGNVCGYLKYGRGDFTIYLQIYNIFMLFWMVNFAVALGQMTLAGAFASYYWAWDKSKDIPAFPLASSFWRCFRYHLGTLAFGSLIIAIVQMIRIFLEYLDHKLKGSENAVAKFFLKCLKCCFWCLEKFIKFINKNAYIITAIYGKNFCMAAKDAFFLILRNVVRVVVIDKVTDFLLFIGKLVVVGLVGAGSFFFFDGRIPYLAKYTPNLNFYVVPIVVVIIGSYIIAACFFSVYGMAVDTLFLCFLEDLERHDGSADKPYYMSKEMMGILGKKNAIPKKND